MSSLSLNGSRWEWTVRASLFFAALICGVAPVHATALPPGQTVALNDTPSPTGANFVSNSNNPFTATNGTSFSGQLASSVFNTDPNNPNGPAALTFVYVLSNSANSVDSLTRMAMGNFTGLTVDTAVNLFSGPPDIRPVSADRSANGSIIGFAFGPGSPGPIAPGGRSVTLVVRTSATQFGSVNATIVGNSGALGTAAIFAPTVPEPIAATSLVALALATMLRRPANRN